MTNYYNFIIKFHQHSQQFFLLDFYKIKDSEMLIHITETFKLMLLIKPVGFYFHQNMSKLFTILFN